MESTRVIASVAVLFLALTGAHLLSAATRSRSGSGAQISAAATGEKLFRVMSALDLATSRVKQVPACGELFANLGRTGAAMLAGGRFEFAGSEDEERICRRLNAAAFTTVGGTTTSLCPTVFFHLDRSEAAVILIHEALHQAGLSERSHAAAAPSSMEINRLVRSACRL